MKKYFVFCVLTVILGLMAISCRQPLIPEGDDYGDDPQEEVVVPLHLGIAPIDGGTNVTAYVGEDSTATKSDLYSDAIYDKITDMNYYLFYNGNLVDQKYFSSSDDFAVMLPDKDKSYNLYIVANIGQKTISSSSTESSLSSYKISYAASNYISTMQSKGFPMYLKITGFNSQHNGSFLLTRLVHKLYVYINYSDFQDYGYPQDSKLSLRNMPLDVHPFVSSSRPDIVGQYLEQDTDSHSLDDGRVVSMYVLENMQGNLFSGNTRWIDKKDSYAKSRNIDISKATHVDLDFVVASDNGVYQYRTVRTCYLGSSPVNCDLPRNSFTDVELYPISTYDPGDDGGETVTEELVNPYIFLDQGGHYQNGKHVLVPGTTLNVGIDTNIPTSLLEFTISQTNGNPDFSLDDSRISSGELTLIPTHTIKYALREDGGTFSSDFFRHATLTVSALKGKENEFCQTFDIWLQEFAFPVFWKIKKVTSGGYDYYFLTLDEDNYIWSNLYGSDYWWEQGYKFKIVAQSDSFIKGTTRWYERDAFGAYHEQDFQQWLTPSDGVNSLCPEGILLSSDDPLYDTNYNFANNKWLYRKGLLQMGAARLADAGYKPGAVSNGNWVECFPQDLRIVLNVKIYLVKGSQQWEYPTIDKFDGSFPIPICFSRYHAKRYDLQNCSHPASAGSSDYLSAFFDPHQLVNNLTLQGIGGGRVPANQLIDDDFDFPLMYYDDIEFNDWSDGNQHWDLGWSTRHLLYPTNTSGTSRRFGYNIGTWGTLYYVSGSNANNHIVTIDMSYDSSTSAFRTDGGNFMMWIGNDGTWNYSLPGCL